MIVFSDDTWFEALWFVNASDEAHKRLHTEAGGLCDVYGGLYRPMKGGPWTLKYRFRYGPREGDADNDEKSWVEYRIDAQLSAEEVLDRTRLMFKLLAATMPAAYMDEVLVQGNGTLAGHLLAQQSWAQLKPAREPS